MILWLAKLVSIDDTMIVKLLSIKCIQTIMIYVFFTYIYSVYLLFDMESQILRKYDHIVFHLIHYYCMNILLWIVDNSGMIVENTSSNIRKCKNNGQYKSNNIGKWMKMGSSGCQVRKIQLNQGDTCCIALGKMRSSIHPQCPGSLFSAWFETGKSTIDIHLARECPHWIILKQHLGSSYSGGFPVT